MKRCILILFLMLLALPGFVYATAGPSDPPTPTGYGSVTAKTAYISATTNGANQVVAAVTGKSIVVWAFTISAAISTNVYWESATTAITNTVYLAANGGWTGDPVAVGTTPHFRTNLGEALQLNCSSTGPTGVWVKYTEENQ
jgi:hypothetical protein